MNFVQCPCFVPAFCPCQNPFISRVYKLKGTKGQIYLRKELKKKVSIFYHRKRYFCKNKKDFTKIFVPLSLFFSETLYSQGLQRKLTGAKKDKLRGKKRWNPT